jgi:hypothetical protein
MLHIKNIFKGGSKEELEKIVNKHYQDKIQGSSVVNLETKYTIYFNAIGRNKTAFGGRRPETQMDSIKASAIFNLKELIMRAKYVETTEPKEKHIKKYGAVGFVVLKATCYIDDKPYSFKISCMIRKNDYKMHYSINEDYAV